jgi:hypothetical protein
LNHAGDVPIVDGVNINLIALGRWIFSATRQAQSCSYDEISGSSLIKRMSDTRKSDGGDLAASPSSSREIRHDDDGADLGVLPTVVTTY